MHSIICPALPLLASIIFTLTRRKDRPDKSRRGKESQPLDELTDRLILRLVHEAAAGLREGLVADEDLLDADDGWAALTQARPENAQRS